MAFGPPYQRGEVGQLASLDCGSGLTANPPTNNITWIRNGNVVEDSTQYQYITDQSTVKLNIGCVLPEDFVSWTCIVTQFYHHYRNNSVMTTVRLFPGA